VCGASAAKKFLPLKINSLKLLYRSCFSAVCRVKTKGFGSALSGGNPLAFLGSGTLSYLPEALPLSDRREWHKTNKK
jgi:hypothetical protein